MIDVPSRPFVLLSKNISSCCGLYIFLDEISPSRLSWLRSDDNHRFLKGLVEGQSCKGKHVCQPVEKKPIKQQQGWKIWNNPSLP